MQEGFQFQAAIVKFNEMYRMPGGGTVPDLHGIGQPPQQRLLDFLKIMRDELDEGLDIIQLLNGRVDGDMVGLKALLPDATDEELATVAVMDWLGDLVVYATSEAQRFGINLTTVLYVIMMSNMSKMGADGQPIYNDFGKLEKGPNYWKPEPILLNVLRAQRKAAADEANPAVVTDAEVKAPSMQSDLNPGMPTLAPTTTGFLNTEAPASVNDQPVGGNA